MRQVASGLAISHIVFMYAGHGSDASAYMKGLTYESFVVATTYSLYGSRVNEIVTRCRSK